MNVTEKLRQECFLYVLKEHSGAFYRYAYSVLLSRQDAEDAVSETVLKAFEHLQDLKHLYKMKSWMFRILANTCSTLLQNRLSVSPQPENETATVRDLESSMDLHNCIYQMEPEFREVVVLYYFEDLKTKEIARILDIPEGTVKSRLSRARDRLKQLLK